MLYILYNIIYIIYMYVEISDREKQHILHILARELFRTFHECSYNNLIR